MSTFRFVALALTTVLTACGGGGGSSKVGSSPPTPSPTAEPTREELVEASRFAAKATFGLAFEQLRALAVTGRDAWLDQQFSLPIGFHSPTVDDLVAKRDAGEFEAFEEDIELLSQFRRLSWWNCAINCDDVVRQRVAFALSEIMVVSDRVDELIVYPYALSGYYDTLLQHAFGNYRDLLRDVARHPAMGVYLSHINNARSNPSANTFPDENFAREVMQLFSIGLLELNLDGSLRLNDKGQSIATYDNRDIRELAKVFTGFSWGGPGAFFGNIEPHFRAPMQMFDEFHEPGEKRLLNDVVTAAGQTGEQDFEAAIDMLFNHPNVAPFIGKALIQRLVTSNPSPAYIERVASAFNDDGTGIRGNMRALVRAVLTDPEAQLSIDLASIFGKLREPVVRYLNMLRLFNATSDDGFTAISGYLLQELGRQHPLSAPSVFNFFLPTYTPPGEIAQAELVAPEFQIVNSSTVVNMVNLLDFALFAEFATDAPPPFVNSILDLAELATLAGDVDALLERLDIVLTYGSMSEASLDVIHGVVSDIPDNLLRAKLGIYMFMMSADYVVRI